MKKLGYCFIFTLMLMVYACESNLDMDKVRRIKSNSYIGAYYKPKTIDIKKFITEEDPSGLINICSHDWDFYYITTRESTPDGINFNYISEYYGDNGYDTTFTYIIPGDLNAFLADEIESIRISSTHSYNGIPAGSSLNGSFYLYAMSMYPFIKSGYSDKFPYSTEYAPEIFNLMLKYLYDYRNSYFGNPVYGTVDSIVPNQLKLIGGGKKLNNIMFLLQMKQIPSNPEGDLIISITFKGGKQLEARAPLSELV